MNNMKIVHGMGFDADIIENGVTVASASFYGADTIGDIAEFNCGISERNNGVDLFLCVELDTGKYRDLSDGVDFQDDYARKVAQMVYEMLRMA